MPTGAGSGADASGGNAGSGSGGNGGSGGVAVAGSGGSEAGRGGNGATGGSNATGGTSASGGTSTSSGGSGGTGASPDDAGQGGDDSGSNGGDGNESGRGGSAGMGGSGPVNEPSCIYHSDPAPSGGEGGAAALANGVAVATNPFLGPYLTDLAGMTLYIYGADIPGDCTTPPVSNCTDDCVQAWPIFDAGERSLDPTLDDAVFGTIQRSDGTYQTTFYGWPLYLYKSDTTGNTINGQGKGKVWFVAEVQLPNVMIMRGPTSGGGIRYLSDDRGRTLYALPGDTLGGNGADPVSSCTGSCLDTFSPFAPGAVYPVTSIEPHDVDLFFREGGSLQTAYKGAPLYYAKSDLHAGEQNGLGVLGAALVLP